MVLFSVPLDGNSRTSHVEIKPFHYFFLSHALQIEPMRTVIQVLANHDRRRFHSWLKVNSYSWVGSTEVHNVRFDEIPDPFG